VYVLFGQGGNIAASVGEDGIYIIDDQFAKLSNDIKKTISDLKPGMAATKTLPKPVRMSLRTTTYISD